MVFDPLGYVDAAAVEHTRDLGAVRVVAASHPHMYGCQTAWAQALDAPVAHDAGWCRRPDRVTYLRETYELGSALTLHWVGGHFRSQTVAGWRTGNAGAGVLLAGEAVSPNPDRRTVTFMRSFPNRLPLCQDREGAVASTVLSPVVRESKRASRSTSPSTARIVM